MKLTAKISAGLLSGCLLVAVSAQTDAAKPNSPATPAVTPPPAAPPAVVAPAVPPAPKFTEEQLLETLGWFVGRRLGLSEVGLTAEQGVLVAKGLQLSIVGKDSPYDVNTIGPELDKFMKAKHDAYVEKARVAGIAETAKFFAGLKAKPGLVTLPSGLAYEIVKEGTGPFPKATDTVKVHYTGTLINGTVFDSSIKAYQPGAAPQPAQFQLNGVIPGWTEGLQKIAKGGKIKLYVPPQLAYGDNARPNIPASSTLIFDVELLDIVPDVTAVPPAPKPPEVTK